MKTFLLLPVLLALVLAPVAARAADMKVEDDAIHKRHDEWVAAWNKHDAKALAAFWVADGDVINPMGRTAKGTAEIEKLFTDEHSGAMAGTTYSGKIVSIRRLGDVAIVDVDGEVTGMKDADGKEMPPFKHHVTWIATKKDGKWMAVCARAFCYQMNEDMADK